MMHCACDDCSEHGYWECWCIKCDTCGLCRFCGDHDKCGITSCNEAMEIYIP